MAEPGRTMWVGQRDHALLLLALQTETNLISLRCKDVVLGAGAHIRCSTTGDRKAALPFAAKRQSWSRLDWPAP